MKKSKSTTSTHGRAIRTKEQIKEAAIKARRRFKALVLLVIYNLYWLQQDVDEELGENVRRNVKILLRKKRKDTSLNFYEKTLLIKPARSRTEEEKQLIYKIIGGLKCFKNYPEHVKKQLAGVTYFHYFPPGRVIVRQGRPGLALYFIMSGEVSVSITSLDPLLNEMKTVVVGTMITGQMFGEVSLLHDIPRTATITTASNVEVLLLYKDDFNYILRKSLKALWDKILFSLKRFTYFDNWNHVQRRECCIYSKIRSFRKDEIIYGPHKRSICAFIILKGECKLIERLPVVQNKKCPRRSYTLFNEVQYQEDMKQLNYLACAADESVDTLKQSISQAALKSSIKMNRYSGRDFNKIVRIRSDLRKKEEDDNKPKQQQRGSVNEEIDRHNYKLPSFVKTVFMQVCTYRELGCFNLGENLQNRFIVANVEEVECLMIPRYWLFNQDKDNMWTKLVQVLNTEIPDTKEIFQIFCQNRQWGAKNRKMINAMVGKTPQNTENNIPYSIRLRDRLDYGVYYR